MSIKSMVGALTCLFLTSAGCMPWGNPSSPDIEHTPVSKTRHSTCYDTDGNPIPCAGTGEDGEYQKRVEWPNPRFTVIYCDTNGPCSHQGTDCDADPDTDVVMDNLTGLMWTRDANMFGKRTWQQALDECNNLGFAGYDDWRLPSGSELKSLLDVENGRRDPALSNTAGTGKWSEGDPFTHQVSSYYWSSTTHPSYSIDALLIDFYDGAMSYDHKSRYYLVRAVRSGQ